jgi:DNA-binding GntR family transcriptional regulator
MSDMDKEGVLAGRRDGSVTALRDTKESKLSERVYRAETSRLIDNTIEAIRASILDGRLAPGERLLEVQLAQVLGISRGPLREALHVLEKDGIIFSVPRRGRFVQTFDLEIIDEVYSFRKVLELFALDRVIGRSQLNGVEPLAAAYGRMEQAAGQNDGRLLARLDIAFHRELVALAGHSILMRSWNENIDGKLQILLNVTTRTHRNLREALERHVLVLDAVRAGNRKHAQRVLIQHIDHAWERARSGYAERQASVHAT